MYINPHKSIFRYNRLEAVPLIEIAIMCDV